MLSDRGCRKRDGLRLDSQLLLAAAGFITGEALLGIALAVPVAVAAKKEPLALFVGKDGPAFANFWVPSVIFVVVALVLLYVLALRPPSTRKS